MPRKIINVVGAAIIKDGKVLCARRGEGKSLAGYWEFPGGKIESHESARQALHREIEEELLCESDILPRLMRGGGECHIMFHTLFHVTFRYIFPTKSRKERSTVTTAI